jgi:hypothetical protein
METVRNIRTMMTSWRKLTRKGGRWLDRNSCAYSYVMEACSLHDEAKLVVKANNGGTMAAVVVKILDKDSKLSSNQ